MIFELWRSKEENSQLFIPKDESYEKHMQNNIQITPDLELIWSCEAKSYFEGMQLYYDYMNWGKYKPEPDWKNTIYK